MNGFDFPLLACLPELSNEQKHERILAGLADVDAGRIISHDEVMSWVRSVLKSSFGSKEADSDQLLRGVGSGLIFLHFVSPK